MRPLNSDDGELLPPDICHTLLTAIKKQNAYEVSMTELLLYDLPINKYVDYDLH